MAAKNIPEIVSKKAVIREMDAEELESYIEDMQEKYHGYLLSLEEIQLLNYAKSKLEELL